MKRVPVDSVLRGMALLALLFLSLLLLGCGQEKDQAQPAAQAVAISEPEEPPAPAPQAVIVFTIGEVAIGQGNSWYDAEIGVVLEPDAVIRVGAASYCELQLGSLAVVRVDADTALAVASLSEPGRPEAAAINLERGTVASKVRRIIGTESFEVRTATVTAGVRGTEFVVTQQGPGETVVAVQDGAVELSPPGVALGDIRREAQDKGPEAQAAVGQLQAALPVVSAGQQVTLDQQRSDEMSAALGQPAAQLLQVVRAADPDAHALEEVGGRIAAAQQTLDRAAPREAISPQSRTRLEPAADLQFRDLDALPRARPQQRPEPPPDAEPPAAETAAVRTDPAPAAPPQPLQPAAPTAAPAPTPAAQPQPPQRVLLSVTVIPADAEITVNGRRVGRGSWSDRFEVAERVSLAAGRPGFAPVQQSVTIGSGPNEVHLRLDPRPVEARFAVSSVAPAGGIAADGNRVVVMDRDGRLAAYDLSGRRLWQIATDNSAVQFGRPVIADGVVYTSGARELAAVELDTGQVLLRHQLSADEANPFGHRPALADGELYFTAGDRIVVRQARSAQIVREISLPASTRMSPSIRGDQLLLADQRGQFFVIDRRSAAVVASVATPAAQPVSQAVARSGERALFSGRRDTVVSIDLSGARVAWTQSIDGQALFEDPVIAGAGVYLHSEDRLFGLRLSDGVPLFEPVSGVTTAAVHLDGLLFAGHADGALLGLDPASGRVVRRLNLAGIPSRLVAHQGRLLIGMQGGELWVVHPAGIVASR
ncbi:MAG: hypothetical protein EA404_02290 [Spirochaetaceae bacterium]|nr:MAG: hypothetical protein EA404_02290 [Spirochaetaceae bacterium]